MNAVVSYEPATAHDLDELGRFDPVRARERFASGFEPACTRHVLLEGRRVGFVVVKSHPDGLLLDHLYLRPAAQGQGVGGRVLMDVLADADAQRRAVLVGALRGSAANAFYIRHGFLRVGEAEWDVFYRRDPS
jgi:GNAT superfamily N-acetyltransferase